MGSEQLEVGLIVQSSSLKVFFVGVPFNRDYDHEYRLVSRNGRWVGASIYAKPLSPKNVASSESRYALRLKDSRPGCKKGFWGAF